MASVRSQPPVSVLLPAYNHEAYVEESVVSVLEQTYPGIELILVDDGSRDGTAEVCRRLAARHPSIRFHQQANAGVSETLNRMIQGARGKYLAFLASDDQYLPDKIRRQVELLEARPDLGAVFSLAEIIDQTGTPILHVSGHPFSSFPDQRELVPSMLVGNVLCATTCLLRRSMVDELGGFDVELRYTQDYDYWLRLLAVSEVGLLQEKLTRYRIHGKNLSGSNLRASADETWQVIRRRAAPVLERHPEHLGQLGAIEHALARLSYGARKWRMAALTLERYREHYDAPLDYDLILLNCHLELGESEKARARCREVLRRALRYDDDRRALLFRIARQLGLPVEPSNQGMES